MFPVTHSLQLYLGTKYYLGPTSIIVQTKLWRKHITKISVANLHNIHIRACVSDYIPIIYFTLAK